MTPNELYAMPTTEVGDLDWLKGSRYNHVCEIEGLYIPWDAKSDRVEIRVIKDFCFDGRRIWRLATVWFDGGPVMVIQNAGREGDDFSNRFITDKDAFRQMCVHLRDLFAPEVDEPYYNCYTGDDVIPELISFYGQSLQDTFERY